MVTATGSAGEASREGPCRFTQRDVIGSWSTTPYDSGVVKDDRREFTIELDDKQRLFSEYLHHRPMGDGIWRFDSASCTVTLDYRHSDSETLRLTGARRLRLVGEGGVIYHKLKPTRR